MTYALCEVKRNEGSWLRTKTLRRDADDPLCPATRWTTRPGHRHHHDHHHQPRTRAEQHFLCQCAAAWDDVVGKSKQQALYRADHEVHDPSHGSGYAQLTRIPERRPLFSLHGVGSSIGTESAPDPRHLDQLETLIARHRPAAFSEYLAWSTHEGRFFNHVLSLCYDEATLRRVCDQINRIQERLGLRLLLENPSTDREFSARTYSEPEFIAAIVRATGCGLLLDVNNV